MEVTYNSIAAAPMGRIHTSSNLSDHVVNFSDVSTFITRTEFRLHRGQIFDSGSDISYNSLSNQIEEGLQEGFSETEIFSTILKLTKPGTSREILSNKEDLTVDGLKRFLQSHIRDKNITELF